MKIQRTLILLLLPTLFFFSCQGQKTTYFEPTIESLRHYECPEWFRDAKFGIYCSWNAQSVYTEDYYGWEARQIYDENTLAYQIHCKKFGHPSKVGYKDVIKAWKADKFDAEEWATLFEKAGAKYMIAMAVHHDNFDMWDSKYQPKWNSMHYGPKCDVVKEIKKAALNHHMRFGVTTHLERAYSWMQTNKLCDTKGPLKGVPYDGNDPAYKDLYLEYSKDCNSASPINPPVWWREHWRKRMYDLIDKYQPDHFYFDGGVPFLGDDSLHSGLDVIAHFYNVNIKKYGKNEGAMFIKDVPRHGKYIQGISSLDFEGAQSDKPLKEPWQTDTSISYWSHNKHNVGWWYDENAGYFTVKEIIETLSDIVSKNGNLLLNVPPCEDGTFIPLIKERLYGIGNWLKTNGEAIYATRPWTNYGEKDIRYTIKGPILYAIVFNRGNSSVLMEKLKNQEIHSIKDIHDADIPYETTSNGVLVNHLTFDDDTPIVLKIYR